MGRYGLFFTTRGLIRPGPIAIEATEEMQTSMLEAGFEPTDYITKWQHFTI